jgi:hypothetical protein
MMFGADATAAARRISLRNFASLLASFAVSVGGFTAKDAKESAKDRKVRLRA